MEIEKVMIKMKTSENDIKTIELRLYEESPSNSDNVMVEVLLEGKITRYENENYFDALLDFRKDMEEQNTQIMCNGSARTVYPSGMCLSMGSGIKAYRLEIGKQAKLADLVNIFDCDDNLEFVTINEQKNFFEEWIKSL